MGDTGKEVKRVIGLKYEVGSGLPRVVLKGSGRLADEVLERREELLGPPVLENKELVRELYKLPVDTEIGSDLFELVAALLVHVYAIEEKLKQE